MLAVMCIRSASLLYQLLTGQLPFEGSDEDLGQLLNAMRRGPRPPSLAPALSEHVASFARPAVPAKNSVSN